MYLEIELVPRIQEARPRTATVDLVIFLLGGPGLAVAVNANACPPRPRWQGRGVEGEIEALGA